MRPLRLAALSASSMLLLIACSEELGGPDPETTGVEPNPICTAQEDQVVTIDGEEFSPAVVEGLRDSAEVEMPRVYFAGPDGEKQIDPANVALPEGDRSGTALEVTIPAGFLDPTEAGEEALVYDVRVQNSNENEGTLGEALTVVPPPELVALDPDNAPTGEDVDVTLTGTGFRDGMTVILEADPAREGEDVEVESQTEADVTFDLSNVDPGTYDVTVQNTDGCSFTLEDAFTVVAAEEFELTGIDPPFGYVEEPTTVTISSDGEFASTPRVEMRPADGEGDTVQFERVAFVSASTITAVVPPGAELGDYDVRVFNPPRDGGLGTLEEAFRVVENPIPRIEAISPARGEPGTETDVEIFGENFRDPVRVQLLDENEDAVVEVDDVEPEDGGLIETTFDLDGVAEDIYLVRVTNLDEETFSTFSNFQVASLGPDGNLAPFEQAAPLNTGRRMLASADARDTLGNRHLYAIGGDTGEDGDILRSIESAQLSRFGDLGSWAEGRHALNTARVGAAAVSVPVIDPAESLFIPQKTYMYVLGGMDDEDNVLGSIERALVLSPDDTPEITDIGASQQEGELESGTWYYEVSAVRSEEHDDNPGGETLPSLEEVYTLSGSASAIDLEWEGVDDAEHYRVYRTPEVNGASGDQELLADDVEGTSYTDTGEEDTEASETPLPLGATGAWVEVGETLEQPRWGHEAALVDDPDGDRFVHVLGGRSERDGGYLDSVEITEAGEDGELVEAFRGDGTEPLLEPRSHFSLAVHTAEQVSGFDGIARFAIVGGVEADNAGETPGQATNALEFSEVLAEGENDAWVGYEDATTANHPNRTGDRAGPQAVITTEKLFIMGGAGNADDTSFSDIEGQDEAVHFEDGEISGPFSDTGEGNLLQSRALGSVVSRAGFIYFIGGTSDGEDALETVERTF